MRSATKNLIALVALGGILVGSAVGLGIRMYKDIQNICMQNIQPMTYAEIMSDIKKSPLSEKTAQFYTDNCKLVSIITCVDLEEKICIYRDQPHDYLSDFKFKLNNNYEVRFGQYDDQVRVYRTNEIINDPILNEVVNDSVLIKKANNIANSILYSILEEQEKLLEKRTTWLEESNCKRI